MDVLRRTLAFVGVCVLWPGLAGQLLFTDPHHQPLEECRTRDNSPGRCVRVEDCTEFTNIGQVMQSRPKICRFQGLDAIICCKKRIITTARRQCGNATRTIRPVFSPLLLRKRRHTVVSPLSDVFDQLGDGGDFHVTVVGGTEATLGQWPWMALLGEAGKGPDGTERWFCGGSLIAPSHVLTAAHCVRRGDDPGQVSDLVVRVGDHQLSVSGEVEHQQRRAAHVLVHPGYRRSQNDLALIRLDAPVESVPPVCLPPAGSRHHGQLADLAGWGLLQFAGNGTTDLLQQVTLKVIEAQKCEQRYRQIPSYNRNFPGGFQDTKLCASDPQGGEKDACQGDSGGPLVYQDPETQLYQQIGVVSVGVGCGNPDFPGVYTRVSAYIDWIEQNIS